MLRRTVLALTLGALAVLVAVSPARADGDFYMVTGFGDGGGSCAVDPNGSGMIDCPTLRAAVAAADAAGPDTDEIFLQPGTYRLSAVIPLTTNVDIFGGNARDTFIDGGRATRLFTVAGGTAVTFYGVTLTRGATAGDGGAIDNSGRLELFEARVTDNHAANGGGIANEANGELDIAYSLIDGNLATGFGGGLRNSGALGIYASTIALNHGDRVGGISSPATQSVSLTHVTVAGNVADGSTNPGGVAFGGPWTSEGSLFLLNDGDNNPSNCGSPQAGGAGNLEDGSGCGFTTQATGWPATITLVTRDGMTDVVDVTGTAAKAFEPTCSFPIDQRLGQRDANAPCDAGAYQEGVPAGAITPLFPVPPPTATPVVVPTPTPVVTATPTPPPPANPTPVPQKDVVAKPVKGTVKVRLPGTNQFIELDGTQSIPVGATVDTKHGTVQLTSLQTAGGKPQTASFFDGIFKLTQTKATTDLTLTEGLAPCPKRGKASAAAKKPKTRKLWGDGKGAFRTRGQYSAATVRGTQWLVQDSCAGTLTRVKTGLVAVRDNVRRKTVVVRAGHTYLAKPRH